MPAAVFGRMRVRLYVDGRRFDPHVRQYSFVEIAHEIIYTAYLSLPLIEEGQMSVTGERMVICLGGLPRNSVDRLTDRTRNDLKSVEGP